MIINFKDEEVEALFKKLKSPLYENIKKVALRKLILFLLIGLWSEGKGTIFFCGHDTFLFVLFMLYAEYIEER